MKKNSLISPAFADLLAFRILIVLSYQMVAVIVGWHIYELTHDTLALGLLGLSEAIPYFCCALFAGYAVDHHSRRLFAVMACVLLVINSAALVAVSMGLLPGDATYWIYASIMLNGAARAFIGPSYNALFALILPRDQYARASGVSSSVFQIGLMLGPALGGLLVAAAGKTTAYSVATLLALLATVALLLLRVKEPPSAASASVFTSIYEGLHFVFSNKLMLSAMSLDMFAVLFGGAVSMLPAFIHEIYGYGAEGLGLLRASPAVGAMLVGLILAKHPINRHAGLWLLGSVAGFGVCIIGFGLSQHFWLAGLLLMFSGIFDGISVVMRTTIYQLITPDDMRGRISAINGIFIGSSNELGAFESGVMARLMGLVPSVVFGGAMTLLVVGVVAKVSPKLRRLELRELH